MLDYKSRCGGVGWLNLYVPVQYSPSYTLCFQVVFFKINSRNRLSALVMMTWKACSISLF